MNTSVITGDIVNSRHIEPEKWMVSLKSVLNKFGKEPGQWEIFRGDSFQLEIKPIYAFRNRLANHLYTTCIIVNDIIDFCNNGIINNYEGNHNEMEF